jgi:hypothetical protein
MPNSNWLSISLEEETWTPKKPCNPVAHLNGSSGSDFDRFLGLVVAL